MAKKAVIVASVLICFLVAWLYEENRTARKVRPPEGATNLVVFLKARPQPSMIRKFVLNGDMHVEVIGDPVRSPLSMPSGPPAYIFDETGTLVDWTPDRGDAPSFVRKWGSLSNATFITVEEAKHLANADQR